MVGTSNGNWTLGLATRSLFGSQRAAPMPLLCHLSVAIGVSRWSRTSFWWNKWGTFKRSMGISCGSKIWASKFDPQVANQGWFVPGLAASLPHISQNYGDIIGMSTYPRMNPESLLLSCYGIIWIPVNYWRVPCRQGQEWFPPLLGVPNFDP